MQRQPAPLFTELLRPLAGENAWEFVERGSNIVAPLALFAVRIDPHRRYWQ
jgi:hypothetical protein